MSDDLQVQARPDRTRVALIAILALLLALLAGMTYTLFTVLTPLGAPGGAGAALPTGMSWVRSIYGWGPAEDQEFKGPTDVAIAPDGTIWGTDPQRARILGFNPDGSYKSMIMRGPAGVGQGRISRPEGVGTDNEGNVYIADFGANKVSVFRPDNTFVREWEVPLPLDVAVTADKVFVSSLYGVAVFTRDGQNVSLWGKRGTGKDEFDGPRGIAVGPDGTVFVADTNNARLKAYKQDGTLLWIWPSDRETAKRPGAGNQLKTLLQLPGSMTIDGQGHVVFIDPFMFQMVVVDPAKPEKDRMVGSYGEQGTKDGFFAYPTGLAYDATRDWFVVADTNNDRLQVVRVPGTAVNPITPAVSRAFAGPWWLCGIPLALLVLAAVVLAMRARAASRARLDAEARAGARIASPDASEAGNVVVADDDQWYAPKDEDEEESPHL